MPLSAIARLRCKLLRIGGTDVQVAPDPYLEDILKRGELFVPEEIQIVRGLRNRCHRNAAVLWLRGRASAIMTGYYLAIDHVWHQHSWGITDSGILLDTHCGGRRYFGVRLEDLQAMVFAESNYGFREVMRWGDKNPERFAALVDAARKLIAS
jgi:hypothetical protein